MHTKKMILTYFIVSSLIIAIIYFIFLYQASGNRSELTSPATIDPPVFVRMKKEYLDSLMARSADLNGYIVVPTGSNAYGFIKKDPSATLRSLLTKPPITPSNDPLKPLYWKTNNPDTLQITMRAYKDLSEIDVPTDLLYVLIK
jgi:hypothetical protein